MNRKFQIANLRLQISKGISSKSAICHLKSEIKNEPPRANGNGSSPIRSRIMPVNTLNISLLPSPPGAEAKIALSLIAQGFERLGASEDFDLIPEEIGLATVHRGWTILPDPTKSLYVELRSPRGEWWARGCPPGINIINWAKQLLETGYLTAPSGTEATP